MLVYDGRIESREWVESGAQSWYAPMRLAT